MSKFHHFQVYTRWRTLLSGEFEWMRLILFVFVLYHCCVLNKRIINFIRFATVPREFYYIVIANIFFHIFFGSSDQFCLSICIYCLFWFEKRIWLNFYTHIILNRTRLQEPCVTYTANGPRIHIKFTSLAAARRVQRNSWLYKWYGPI